jgi:heat shock protein HslJ
MIRIAFTLASLTVLATAAPANGSSTFRAQGNEPFWSLRMTDSELTFQPMEGSAVTVTPLPSPRLDSNAEVYEATAGGESLVLTIASKVCTDTMSGMPFPKSVTVALGAQTLKGCGGEPATLLHGAWLITEINGKPIIAASSPGLNFETDGKVNGNGSCNRFFGGYQLSGEGLTVGSVGASMMMCDEALMDQEGQIFKVLKELAGFGISGDGKLILRTNDGRTMTAKPDA